jgi:predicted kinase
VTSLLITRGLPASGKTTYAKAWVAEDREHRARVNRDDLRVMVDDGEYVQGVTEARIVAARDASILALLNRGVDVICDDTNLPQRVARDLAKIAARAGAELTVIDLTDVPLDVCLIRNSARTDKGPLPEDRIRDMHARYLKGRAWPLPLPEEPGGASEPGALYKPRPGTRKAVLVDIDGTVALKGARSPFDESRVHEDRPNAPVIEVARAMSDAGCRLVFLSGRTDACRDATVRWLGEHVQRGFDGPFMRAAGDMRKDFTVKLELFDHHVRDAYDVACVLDDRTQVVDAWRSIGLTCLQVGPGDF